MQLKLAFQISLVVGAVLCVVAAWQILHYQSTDGASRFLIGIVLPFSAGFACFVLAQQFRKRGTRTGRPDR